MEDDLEILEKALLNLEATEPEESQASNYEGLYKNWGKLGNQEERRKQLLEIQKRYNLNFCFNALYSKRIIFTWLMSPSQLII